MCQVLVLLIVALRMAGMMVIVDAELMLGSSGMMDCFKKSE